MSRSIRWLILSAFPLTACNVQISNPDGLSYGGNGSTRLPAPSGLTSISLDGAIQLSWSGSVVANFPNQFRIYRVYSTRFLSGSGRCDDGGWSLEGTTVSDGFLVSNLLNGVTRCFAVSTVAQDGGEGSRGPARADTPRHGGSFVLIDAFDARPSSSGWLFHDVAAGLVGVVGDGRRSDLDFRVERHSDGSLWLRPVRSSERLQVFGSAPIPDLTWLDRAPSSGYAFIEAEAVAGYAYVFLIPQADGVHYGALRVAYTGRDYVVIDWSYQSAPNNAELLRM
jgi:hypothetical protein